METKYENLSPISNPAQRSKPTINDKFIVYSQKKKIQKDLEQQGLLQQSQESNPNARAHETSPCNSSFELNTSESASNGLDCPIAVRSCTDHPNICSNHELSVGS